MRCPFEIVHPFNFHKSGITALCSSNDSTKLISGGADTYLIQYDLVSSMAEFKLLGHTQSITQVQILVTRHPTRGTPQRTLVSAAADGLLKVWSLETQMCMGTFGEQSLQKITDFCLIGELAILVAASADRHLRLFKVEVVVEGEAQSVSEIGAIKLEGTAQLNKESK